MKPSERIKELTNSIEQIDDISFLSARIIAISKYLDEEWEKKGCIEGRHILEVFEKDRIRCKKCNVVVGTQSGF